MAKVESKKVYVRLEPSETVESRRNILESMARLIDMLMISKKFKRLRKEELSDIRKEKTAAQEIIEGIESLQEKLPQMEKLAERKHIGKIKAKKERKEIAIRVPSHALSKSEKYKIELEEIKERLARLG